MSVHLLQGGIQVGLGNPFSLVCLLAVFEKEKKFYMVKKDAARLQLEYVIIGLTIGLSYNSGNAS